MELFNLFIIEFKEIIVNIYNWELTKYIITACLAGLFAGLFAKVFSEMQNKKIDMDRYLDSIHKNLIDHLNLYLSLNVTVSMAAQNKKSLDFLDCGFLLKNLVNKNYTINPDDLIILDNFMRSLKKDNKCFVTHNIIYNNLIKVYLSHYGNKNLTNDTTDDFINSWNEIIERVMININVMILYLEHHNINCSSYKSLVKKYTSQPQGKS